MRISVPALLASLALASVVGATSASAAPPTFHPLPSLDTGPTSLELKVVRYTGSTNGGMIVDVKNAGSNEGFFTPEGLFFVPEGDPESAPQRLGAAGPFEVQTKAGWKDEENLPIAAGQTRRLKLQLFCIDSHRPSPNPSTPFRLAKERLPREIRQKIEAGTKRMLKERKVKNAKDIRGAVQKHVWTTRDSNWVPIEGERAQEKSPRKRKAPRQRRR